MHSKIGRSDPVLGLLCTESEKLTSQSNSVEVHSVLLHCLPLLLKSMWSPVMDWHDRCTSICHSATPGPAVVHVRQRTAARLSQMTWIGSLTGNKRARFGARYGTLHAGCMVAQQLVVLFHRSGELDWIATWSPVSAKFTHSPRLSGFHFCGLVSSQS